MFHCRQEGTELVVSVLFWCHEGLSRNANKRPLHKPAGVHISTLISDDIYFPLDGGKKSLHGGAEMVLGARIARQGASSSVSKIKCRLHICIRYPHISCFFRMSSGALKLQKQQYILLAHNADYCRHPHFSHRTAVIFGHRNKEPRPHQ